MQNLFAAFVFACSAWMYWDASGKKIGKVNGGYGKNYSAGGWALFGLLVPVASLIMYLRQRNKLIEQAHLQPVNASSVLKVLHTLFCVFVVIGMLGSMGASPQPAAAQPTTASHTADVTPAATPPAELNATEPVQATPFDMTALPWNTSDENGLQNGNIELAYTHLRRLGDGSQSVTNIDIAEAISAPWNYYGKPACVNGKVADRQEYPPTSESAELFDKNPVGELVINNQGNLASILVVGGVAGVQVGGFVRLCGLITGRAEDEEKQTRLVMLSGTEEFMRSSQ